MSARSLWIAAVAACVFAAGAAFLLGPKPSATSTDDSVRRTAGRLDLEPALDASAPEVSSDPRADAGAAAIAPTVGPAAEELDLPDSTTPLRAQGDAPEGAPTSIPSEPLDDGPAAAGPDTSPTSILQDGLQQESPVNSASDESPPTSLPADGRNDDAPSAAPAGPAPSPTQAPERR